MVVIVAGHRHLRWWEMEYFIFRLPENPNRRTPRQARFAEQVVAKLSNCPLCSARFDVFSDQALVRSTGIDLTKFEGY